ncbi:MAG: SDR family oxidoreductase [Bacteroidetes bacterium]|nr:SDR family oxidoreductase [Bacteroidales bacterium]NJO69673.1 SDR family oxidoreductase [Bacteroidota bacterium]
MESYSFNDLKDKVCLFTGGTGVLGTSMAECLAAQGVKLALLGRNIKAANDLAERISKETGAHVIGVEGDVLNKESLIEARKKVNEVFGKIDILVNGAGGNAPAATTQVEQIAAPGLQDLEKTFYGLQPEAFDYVFDLNFKGTLLPTMVFTTDMVESGNGVVLNISSMNSFKPLTKIPAYSAAKAAINNFTMWLSVHLAKTGIRVNCIAPGFFLTNQNRFLLTDQTTGELSPRGKKIITSTPMGKFGEPNDLNGAMLYLLSDISSFVTGVVMPVDGGYSAYGGV